MLPRVRRPRRGAPRAAVAGPAGGGGLRTLASPRPRAPRGHAAPRRRLLRPSLRGFQRSGLHTAPPADPEEKAEEDVQEVGRVTGRRGLRAPTMDGTVEAAPAPSCSSRSGSLSASASACWPPALPPLPAPPSLTDPRWPLDGFLCCLRGPEVTTPLPPRARPISVAEEAGRLLLLGETWSCPGPRGRL